MTSLVQLEADLREIITEYTAGHINADEAGKQLQNRSFAVSHWVDAYAAEAGQERADMLERVIRPRILRYVEVLGSDRRDYKPGRFRSVRTVDDAHREYRIHGTIVRLAETANTQDNDAA